MYYKKQMECRVRGHRFDHVWQSSAMEKEEIHFGDIRRWLFGTTPPEFMIEVFIRTVLIYLFLLLIVRLMGKRMSAQMTLTEIAIMVTLGAIVSPAMQLPDRGLFFGVLVLLCALAFLKGYNYLGFISKKAEVITQGYTSLLIKNGEIQLDALADTEVTKQQLYALLREKKIHNLSKVQRAYFEASGKLSVFETKEEKPGLPIIPQCDSGIIPDLQELVDHGTMACTNCGHVQQVPDKKSNCEVCRDSDWSHAYIEHQKEES